MFSSSSVLLLVFLSSAFLAFLKIWKHFSGCLTKWAVLTFSLIHNKLLELEGPRKVFPAPRSPQPDHKDGASATLSIEATQCIPMSAAGRHVLTLNLELSRVTFS